MHSPIPPRTATRSSLPDPSAASPAVFRVQGVAR